MKTLRVATPAARSYGAFEMKEFIGKSTIKSFGLTIGMIVLIPLVCIAVKASVAPVPPMIKITNCPIPITPTSEPKEVIPNIPVKTDLPPSGGIVHSDIGNPIAASDITIDDKIEVGISDIHSTVVDNDGNGGSGTSSTFDVPSTIDVKTTDGKVEDDDNTVIEVESDPILNYEQLQANLIYPDAARRIGVEGKVLLRVVVGKDGKPVTGKVRVLDSSNELFNQAAIDAVLKSSFTPAIQNKQPIEVPVTVPIVFRIR